MSVCKLCDAVVVALLPLAVNHSADTRATDRLGRLLKGDAVGRRLKWSLAQLNEAAVKQRQPVWLTVCCWFAAVIEKG